MTTLLHFLDVVTHDALTLSAACVLAVSVLGLLLVISWPSADAATILPTTRSATARTLAAAGTPPLEIMRRTGLSRDALALLGHATRGNARHNQPRPARFALFRRRRAA